VFGHTQEFTFDGACQTATDWFRPLVLAIAAFIAAWVFVQGLKS
jgi:hypothetical protein